MNKKLIIIDSNAIIHRAYHALPKLTTKKGELVNAVYGFLLFFFKAVKEFSPSYIAAVFDFPAPTFRKEKYDLYKANREKAPEELYGQFPIVKNILESFGVRIFEKRGFEADDLIGTISKKISKENPEIENIILTGDYDALQLVDGNTKVYTFKRGVKDAVLYGIKEVKDKYEGLAPEQLPDFKALRGDPSDNIPGVFGIGEKTAIGLIKKFGSLENVYESMEDIKESVKEKLAKHKDEAFLSKELAKICENAPLDFELKNCEWKGYNKKEGIEKLENYEFYSLAEKIKKENNNFTLF